MNQDQVNQIAGMIKALVNKIAALKNQVNTRFDDFERRVANVEVAISRLSSHTTMQTQNPAGPTNTDAAFELYTAPLGQPVAKIPPSRSFDHQRRQQQSHFLLPGDMSARAVGTRDNVRWLPFAMERMVYISQKKHQDDDQRCKCGAPTFDVDCFREDHFRWCRIHQRPIMHGYQKCGHDYDGCKMVKWEKHPEWENIVRMSMASGLGQRSVSNLEKHLFPQDLFPNKYNRCGEYVG